MRRVGALLWKFVHKRPHPRQRKKACKDKALTSIRSWDNSSSEEEDHHKRREHKHSSSSTSRVCLMARGNKKPIPSDSDNDSDDELPSYHEIVQENLNFAPPLLHQRRPLPTVTPSMVAYTPSAVAATATTPSTSTQVAASLPPPEYGSSTYWIS